MLLYGRFYYYIKIDNDLLNPFKENPYTQPLTSFAY